MSKKTPPTTPPDTPAPLALRPKDAAPLLGVSERHLWTLTNQGLIPHIRLGRAIVYPVDLLKAWMAEQVKGGDV